jgi:tetratricopeptide (TPR) repeat protein
VAQGSNSTQSIAPNQAIETGPVRQTTQINSTGQIGQADQTGKSTQIAQPGLASDVTAQQAGSAQPQGVHERRGGGEASAGGALSAARDQGRQGEGDRSQGQGGGRGSQQREENAHKHQAVAVDPNVRDAATEGTGKSSSAGSAGKPSITDKLGAALDEASLWGSVDKARALDLSLDSRATLERLARGLDKAAYDESSVGAVVAAFIADRDKVAGRIGDLERDAKQKLEHFPGKEESASFTRADLASVRSLIDTNALKAAEAVQVMREASADHPGNPQLASMLAALGDVVAQLQKSRDLRDALEIIIERPEALVPTLPVYSIEAERLSQVEWLPNGQATGSILLTRVQNGDLQRARLDVARTVEGDVVMGRLEAPMFRALDIRGRATHEFIQVAHGLWDRATPYGAEPSRDLVEVRSLLARGRGSLGEGAVGLAQSTFDQVLSADPENLTALMGGARSRLAQGDITGAVQMASRAARLAPDNAETLHLHGVVLKGAGLADEAAGVFAHAEQLLSERMSGPLFGNPVFWERDDLVLRAQVLVELGRHTASQAFLDRVIAESPNDREARETLGAVLLAQGLGEAALREYAKAHELSPQSSTALLGMARAEQMIGRVEEASWSYLQAAQVSFKKGQYHQAISIYTELLEVAPGHCHALTGLGFAYDRLDCAHEAADAFTRAGQAARAEHRQQDALRNFDYALERMPRHVVAQVGRAEVLLALGDTAAARACFDRVLNIEPDNLPALIGRGEVCLATWDYNTAADYFDRVIEIEPTHTRALLLSARAYLSAGAPNLAVFNLDLAQQFTPDDVEVTLLRAQCDLKLGNSAQALTGFETVLAQMPENEEAQSGRLMVLSQRTQGKGESVEQLIEVAEALLAKGSLREASERFERAAGLASDSPVAWKGLGQAHFGLKQFEASRQAFLECLKFSPEEPVAIMGAAQAALAVNDFVTAHALFEAARESSPMNLQAVLGSGNALLGDKRFDEALDCFATALQIDEQNLDAFLGKGEAHLAKGEIDAAQRSFAYALGIEPGNARALSGAQVVMRMMSTPDRLLA